MADVKSVIAQTRDATNLASSTEKLVTGINGIIHDAVDAALKLGATPRQLEPITTVTTALHQHVIALATALVTNVTLTENGRRK